MYVKDHVMRNFFFDLSLSSNRGIGFVKNAITSTGDDEKSARPVFHVCRLSPQLIFLLIQFLDAEGNGDSISAAVQAERIALLTSVLAQTQLGGNNSNVTQTPRSHSLTPPQGRRPFIDLSQAQTRPVHRSQSHFSLGSQYTSQSPPFPAFPLPNHQELVGARKRSREDSSAFKLR